MNGQAYLAIFAIAFAGLWMTVCAMLGATSGWYGLMARFPDRPETPLARIGPTSGVMGAGVRLNNVLSLSVCHGGLRVAIWRLFGPFSRPFLVPWPALSVERRRRLLGPRARLSFGAPEVGSLEISAYLADRLARAAGDRWPEPGRFTLEDASESLAATAMEWAVTTAFAAAFFIIAPTVASGGRLQPPLLPAILFPGVVFGIVALFRYADRRRP